MVQLHYFKPMNCSDYEFDVFAESADFERSIRERDTNLFRKVHTAMQPSSVFRSVTIMLLSLVFRAGASIRIFLDAVDVSLLCGTVGSFPANRVTDWRKTSGLTACFFSNPFGKIFCSLAIVTISQPSSEQSTAFSAFIGFRYFVIQVLITNQGLFLPFVIFSKSSRVCFA